MGVRGLQSFMEWKCPDAAYEVDIKEIVETYRTRKNTEVTIVVDGSSYLPYVYSGLDKVCGGQMRSYKELIENAIQAFRNIGVKLVFFFDGPTLPRKRKVWVKRRLNRLQVVYKMFDDIREGINFCEIRDNRLLPLAVALKEAMAIIKATEGCEIYRSVKECDEEIVSYAVENKCFSILGQDTDFVISSGPLYYLSAAHLNIEKMTTINYDRRVLACHLHISPGLLPLFASLVGNDIIPPDELSPFHKKICSSINSQDSDKFSQSSPLWNIIYKVAEFVRHYTDEKHLYQSLPMFSRRVFGDLSKVSVLDLSVRSYNTNFPTVSQLIDTKSHWEKIKKHAEMLFRSGNLDGIIYAVMHKLPYESYTGLEDFREVDLPPAAAVYLPLRQRIYGIILHEKPNDPKSHLVEEWCMQGERSLDEPAFVSVIFPKPVPTGKTQAAEHEYSIHFIQISMHFTILSVVQTF